MIVELCIILRIVLNESQHYAFQGATIETCKATKDANSGDITPTAKIMPNDYNHQQDSWDMNNGMKSLWIYRPPLILKLLDLGVVVQKNLSKILHPVLLPLLVTGGLVHFSPRESELRFKGEMLLAFLPLFHAVTIYIQPHHSDELQSRHVVMKPPHIVTRLAKPLTFGFDPFFNKGYFEPFERRQKPVSLVAFRKNGIQPREVAFPNGQAESAEVAELQSPFNDLSNLWQDVPDNILNV